MTNTKNSEDCHPDAHACRLKISLVMLDSPVVLPWNLSSEMSSYVRKLQHVSANCRLSLSCLLERGSYVRFILI